MLTFVRRHTNRGEIGKAAPTVARSAAVAHPELEARDLLDDPALRQAMGLDELPRRRPRLPAPVAGQAVPGPKPRLNVRRLLRRASVSHR